MPKSYYLPGDDSGKAELLELLASQLPMYAEQLGLTAEDTSEVQADAEAFRYTLAVLNQIQNSSKQWTAHKNILRDSDTGGPVPSFPPFMEVPAKIPAAIPKGIVPRLTRLVARIKSSRNYTEAIGQALGLVGSIKSIDPSSWKPELTATLEANHPQIAWPKGHADSLEIMVDRGDDKGFVPLTITTSPRYSDTSPVPAHTAVWHYKGIYRLKDEQVGQWSNVQSIAVGG
ncbi:hypothetical protein [Zoogloea dura]|uniref:Uncharacterized protein n=1 Tax=Zoogloea dura TaxID=2728840 RepID=A0A848GE62_9RHOO|nr:hypothetical protein [Zoogloea dura]NML29055.1 hypothetical protein [Zoogloea dura]